MRRKTRKGRQSERLRKNRQSEESPGSDHSIPDITDPEYQPVFVQGHRRADVAGRSGHTSQSSGQEPEPEEEELLSDGEDVMTRLKYKRFKGDGSQDADDWLCEFESTALANQENDAAQRRIFQGLLKGEALK